MHGNDVVCHDGEISLIEGKIIKSDNTHGTGCTYSSAIAAYLALGLELEEAIAKAKAYITEAIRHGLDIGHGPGPVNHFYQFWL